MDVDLSTSETTESPSDLKSFLLKSNLDNDPLSFMILLEMNAARIVAPDTSRCLLLKSASVIVVSRVTGGASCHSPPSTYFSPDQVNLDNDPLSRAKRNVRTLKGDKLLQTHHFGRASVRAMIPLISIPYCPVRALFARLREDNGPLSLTFRMSRMSQVPKMDTCKDTRRNGETMMSDTRSTHIIPFWEHFCNVLGPFDS
jgi:hypothetical protein